MPDLPSRLDLYAIGRSYVRTYAQKIDPATIDIQGSDVNLQVGSQSEVAYALVGQLAGQTSALLIDSAEDEDLDRVVFDRCNGMTRKGASAAVTSVTFSRVSFVVGSGGVPVGTKLRSLTGVEFVTTSLAVFGTTDVTATANVRSVEAGSQSRVGKNAIRQIPELGTLFDPSITVNNDVAAAGGEDREEDPVFRERARQFWRTARRGTLGAIEFGALQVSGVASAQAIEALGGDGQPARLVVLYIADSAGNSNRVLGDVVVQSLDEFRAGGIAVLVSTSIPELISISLALTFSRSVETAALAETVRAAIVEFINNLPVNGTLLRSDLEAVLARYKPDGLIVNEATIVEPAGDVVPIAGRTFRTLSNLVSAQAA